MESKKENIELTEPKYSNKITQSEHTNTFINSLINKLGYFFDKTFIKVNINDFNGKYTELSRLFNHFILCCDKNEIKKEKKLAIQLIYIILLNKIDLNKYYENFLNILLQIIIKDNFIEDKDNFLNKLISCDLKLCLNEEQYTLICQYKKNHQLNINLLFQMLIYFFGENMEKYLLRLVCNDLRTKYQKWMIFGSIIHSNDIKKEDYLNILKQLINLDFKSLEGKKILHSENPELKLRIVPIDELDTDVSHLTPDEKKILIRRFSDDLNSEKFSSYSSIEKEKDSINELNDSNNYFNSNNFNFDINSLNPFEKYILKEMNKYKDRLNSLEDGVKELQVGIKKLQVEVKDLQDGVKELKNREDDLECNVDDKQGKVKNLQKDLKKLKDELKMEKNETDRINSELILSKMNFFKLKFDNKNLEERVNDLEIDLNKIKIIPVYERIINIFTQIFGLNLYDSYEMKIQKILNELESFPQNTNVTSLKYFFLNILSDISEGNNSADSIFENIHFLDYVFFMLKEEFDINYSY